MHEMDRAIFPVATLPVLRKTVARLVPSYETLFIIFYGEIDTFTYKIANVQTILTIKGVIDWVF